MGSLVCLGEQTARAVDIPSSYGPFQALLTLLGQPVHCRDHQPTPLSGLRVESTFLAPPPISLGQLSLTAPLYAFFGSPYDTACCNFLSYLPLQMEGSYLSVGKRS